MTLWYRRLMKASLSPFFGPLRVKLTRWLLGIKKERFRTHNTAGVNHIF